MFQRGGSNRTGANSLPTAHDKRRRCSPPIRSPPRTLMARKLPYIRIRDRIYQLLFWLLCHITGHSSLFFALNIAFLSEAAPPAVLFAPLQMNWHLADGHMGRTVMMNMIRARAADRALPLSHEGSQTAQAISSSRPRLRIRSRPAGPSRDQVAPPWNRRAEPRISGPCQRHDVAMLPDPRHWGFRSWRNWPNSC